MGEGEFKKLNAETQKRIIALSARDADRNQNISAKKVVKTSFIVDLLDLVLNGLVAIFSGSAIMLAESLQGLADLVSAGFIWVGLRQAERPASDKYPYGHGRDIYVWTLFSSIVMFAFLSTISIYLGWKRFIDPEPIKNIFLAYTVLIIAILTNAYAFSLSLKRLLRGSKESTGVLAKILQSAHIETKTALILDLVGTLSAFSGFVSLVIYGITGNGKLDGIGAIIIGIILAVFALLLLFNIKSFLVGRSIPAGEREKIIDAVLSIPEVKSVSDFKALSVGPDRIHINLDIKVDEEMHAVKIGEIIEIAKAKIRKEFPGASHIQIELDTNNKDIGETKKEPDGKET